MTYKIAVIALFCSAITVHAQREDHGLEPFNRIDVFGPFDVELIKSDKEFIELDFRGVDRDNIISEVSKNELRLKLRNRHYFNEWGDDFGTSEYVKVKVYYINIDEVEAQAGARLTTREQLKSRNLMINCSMGAELRMNVLAKNVYSRSSMGAIVNLEGQTDYLEVSAKMGAVYHASHLLSKSAYVKASMGADVDLNVSDEIEISAGMGAIVDYTGGPTVRHTSRSLGAEINGRGN